MKDVDQRRGMGWALPASVTVHALAAALLIFGLPVSLFEAEPEKAIEVDLVPPPEPPKKQETAKQAEAAKPPPPAPKPEPPPPENKPEAKAETQPPEPKPEPNSRPRKRRRSARPKTCCSRCTGSARRTAAPKLAPDGDGAEDAIAGRQARAGQSGRCETRG